MENIIEKAVVVEDITKTFRIPTEASSGIKQALINRLKGKKGYREFTPLKDISFSVNKGDFFGIVGRNGSGKSTLLKTIAGIYTPEKGSIGVNGSLVPFIELGVGFNPELTGRENVFLNGALLGFSRPEIKEMYPDIVEFAELPDFMEEKLKNYSSGMQVRLAFSIAIQAKGDTLLLDEVLAVGDAAFQQKCFDYFERIKKEKKTVIIVTHDMNAVKRFCNRALIINNGVIEAMGDPYDIAEIYTEENIDVAAKDKRKSTSKIDKTNLKISIPKKKYKQTDSVPIHIQHTNINDEPSYINLSIVRKGAVVANINSKGLKTSGPKIDIKFDIDLDNFNPSRYEVYVSVHYLKDDKPVENAVKSVIYLVEGSDKKRDAAMKLKDTWSLVK